MKILFSGGGTMGSVVPLIAVIEKLNENNPEIDIYWIGTKNGPEQALIRNYNIDFRSIRAGKLRRYFSLLNFLDIFNFLIGFLEALYFLIKWRPAVIISAGGYVAVGVVWAGWLLGIPSLIHQQDIRPGLANRLCQPAAKIITVCFENSKQYFKTNKVRLTGNPVREGLKISNFAEIRKKVYDEFGLRDDLPTVLAMGGGTGSLKINELFFNARERLGEFCQVVHVTGKNKTIKDESTIHNLDNYYAYEFIVDTSQILAVADLIVGRAGMGTLTEIAYLKKPAIIIPIPYSHQEENADYFYQAGAVEVLNQNEIDEDRLVLKIKEFLNNKFKASLMAAKAHAIMDWGAEDKIAKLILELARVKE